MNECKYYVPGCMSFYVYVVKWTGKDCVSMMNYSEKQNQIKLQAYAENKMQSGWMSEWVCTNRSPCDILFGAYI